MSRFAELLALAFDGNGVLRLVFQHSCAGKALAARDRH
jgi:hypothetical protein